MTVTPILGDRWTVIEGGRDRHSAEHLTVRLTSSTVTHVCWTCMALFCTFALLLHAVACVVPAPEDFAVVCYTDADCTDSQVCVKSDPVCAHHGFPVCSLPCTNDSECPAPDGAAEDQRGMCQRDGTCITMVNCL